MAIPVLVMCGTEREGPAMFPHAAAAVAATLPNSSLVIRRGLGHSKKLNVKAIAATLTEFLTDPAPGAVGSAQTPATSHGTIPAA